MRADTPFQLPLHSAHAALALVGGKGASLGWMAAVLGLPVRPAFHITTADHRRFVEANALQAVIAEATASAQPDDPASLERASAAMRQLFQSSAVGAGHKTTRYRVHRGSRYKGLPARPGFGRRRARDRASRLISLLGISVRVRKPRLRLRPRLLVQPVARVGADDVAPEAGLVGAAGLGWSRRGGR
jgi:hypothetical protein